MSSIKTLSATLVLVLAGCAASSDEIAPPFLTHGAAQSIGLEAHDCEAMLQVYALEPNLFNRYLPAGYHATDISGILGLNIDLGKAGLVSLNARCLEPESFEVGAWFIFVEAPGLATQLDAKPDSFHGYVLDWRASNNAVADGLDKVNATRQPAAFDWLQGPPVEADGTDALRQTTVVALDGEGQLFTMTNQVAGPRPLTVPTFTLWQEVPNGTMAFHAGFEPLAAGTNISYSTGYATCTLREGLPPHTILGRTECQHVPAAGLEAVDYDPTTWPVGVDIFDFSLPDSVFRTFPGQYAA